MSLVQKVESGYLQLLRVVFLLFATIAIVAVVVFGLQFLAGRNAEPAPVTKKIELSANTYDFGESTSSKSNGTQNQSGSEVKDEQFEKFVTLIQSNAKKQFPDFVLNRDAVGDLFQAMKKDPTLGGPFIEQLLTVMDQAYKNPKFKSKNVPEFGSKSIAMIEHFKSNYRMQAAEIRTAKEDADLEATSTRVSANAAFVSAAGGFGIFVMLILLVVLLKIERNLRGVTPQTVVE